MNQNSKNDETNAQLMLHIKDLVVRTEKSSVTTYTAFLDIHQKALAQKLEEKYKSKVGFKFFGGYEDAERTVLGIYDLFNDEPFEYEYPFRCVTITYNKNKQLTHREILGALMSCMIKRNVIGDIIIGEGKAQFFVLESCAEAVISDLTKISDVSVSLSCDEPVMEVTRSFELIEGTVASVRIDAVIHLVASLSREKASDAIKRGLVIRNGITENSVSRKLDEGDIFSIRGIGKFRLKEIAGITKKGRIRICVEKYK